LKGLVDHTAGLGRTYPNGLRKVFKLQMKKEIHPTFYPDAQVVCACGNTWTTGSTQKMIRTEMCSACHPFYTGEQRIVDTEGQVDRFYKRLKARQEHLTNIKTRKAERTSPERPIAELELSSRATQALQKADIKEVGDVMALLAEGEASVLNIDGFGRKSLTDLKKALRKYGYSIPEKAEEITV
jgi:large subunit ribosomal protein L31